MKTRHKKFLIRVLIEFVICVYAVYLANVHFPAITTNELFWLFCCLLLTTVGIDYGMLYLFDRIDEEPIIMNPNSPSNMFKWFIFTFFTIALVCLAIYMASQFTFYIFPCIVLVGSVIGIIYLIYKAFKKQ
jgi:hypothetical protein